MTSHGNETATKAVRAQEIVVGLDSGPAAAEALRWAVAEALQTDRTVRVVHVWSLSTFEEATGSPEYLAAAEADVRARATGWVLDAIGVPTTSIPTTLEVAYGTPGPVLVEQSAGAAMLVVGTREHTGLHRAVVGSVSHYCVSHADVPVVAITAPPPTDPAREIEVPAGMLTTPGPLL